MDPYNLDDIDDEEYEDILDHGESIMELHWDSGGPGAGAGVVSVLLYKEKYYASDDNGIRGPFKDREEAIRCGGLKEINESTVVIRDKVLGVLYRHSELKSITEQGEPVFYRAYESGSKSTLSLSQKVLLYNEKFYVSDEWGLSGPFDNLEYALSYSGVNVVQEDTLEIWDKVRGFIFQRKDG